MYTISKNDLSLADKYIFAIICDEMQLSLHADKITQNKKAQPVNKVLSGWCHIVKKLSMFGTFVLDEEELLEMPNSMSNDASGASFSNPSLPLESSRIGQLS